MTTVCYRRAHIKKNTQNNLIYEVVKGSNMNITFKQYFMSFIFLIMLIFIAHISYKSHKDYEESQYWIPLNAVIVSSFVEYSSGKHPYYYPVLDVAYNLQNKDYSNQELEGRLTSFDNMDKISAEASTKQIYPNGSTIKVIVDPNDPQHARTINFLKKVPSEIDYVLWGLCGLFIFMIIGTLSSKKFLK
jgi:uncharacterized integral membrane protein